MPRLLHAPTATIPLTRTDARLMATMAPVGSRVASSSERDLGAGVDAIGVTATADGAATAAGGTTVVADIMADVVSPVDVATVAAGTGIQDAVVITAAVAASMAAHAATREADALSVVVVARTGVAAIPLVEADAPLAAVEDTRLVVAATEVAVMVADTGK